MRGQKVSLPDHSDSGKVTKTPHTFLRDEDEEVQEALFASLTAEAKDKEDKRLKGFMRSLGLSTQNIKIKKSKNDNTTVITNMGVAGKDYIYYGPPVYIRNSPYKPEPKEEPEKYKVVRFTVPKFAGDKSIPGKIFKFLSKRKSPAHINIIVARLIKNGTLSSKHTNNYSIVYKAIARNFFIFKKTDKATFTIREGFKPQEERGELAESAKVGIECSSLKDLIIDAIKEISPKTKTSNPSQVFNHLKKYGFNGSYASVYSAMQSSNFTRKSFEYSISKS